MRNLGKTLSVQNLQGLSAPKKTRSQMIAAELFRQITNGHYSEGRLPSQRVLAQTMGVSRNTIVSALAQLSANGWIEIHDRRRAVLTPPDLAFTQKLKAFLNASNFYPPLMNDAIGKTESFSRPEHPSIDLSILCHEHWDDHLNFDIESAAVQSALAQFRRGETNIYHTSGIPRLKEALCDYLRRLNIKASPNEILIVSRRLQAYRLVADVLIGRNTEVWIPELSLPRFYGVAERHTARRRHLAMDGDGKIDFEPALYSKRPKILFLEPTHQKPTGASIDVDDRRRIIASARQANTFIFEDAYCEMLEEVHLPSFASFDPKRETVIHLGAIPTWLTPIGGFSFLLANSHIIDLLRASARRDYLNPEFLTQLIALQLVESGSIYDMISRFHVFHRERRTFTDRVLRTHIGRFGTWSMEGSFGCIWLKLPSINMKRLYDARHNLNFQPGWFYGESVKNCQHALLRYTLPAKDFEDGIRRFGELCHSLFPT